MARKYKMAGGKVVTPRVLIHELVCPFTGVVTGSVEMLESKFDIQFGVEAEPTNEHFGIADVRSDVAAAEHGTYQEIDNAYKMLHDDPFSVDQEEFKTMLKSCGGCGKAFMRKLAIEKPELVFNRGVELSPTMHGEMKKILDELEIPHKDRFYAGQAIKEAKAQGKRTLAEMTSQVKTRAAAIKTALAPK